MKNTTPAPHIRRDAAAIVTQTTARIQGHQTGAISVHAARTTEAVVTVIWGGLLLRFLSAAAAATVLEGFAAARASMMDVDKVAPITELADDVAIPTIALSWTWPTAFAVVQRQAYSKTQRRKVRWVEVHMGPITWQILDTVGYNAALELLREAHRTAVAVCLDGGKWRADPTKDDYQRPVTK